MTSIAASTRRALLWRTSLRARWLAMAEEAVKQLEIEPAQKIRLLGLVDDFPRKHHLALGSETSGWRCGEDLLSLWSSTAVGDAIVS